MNAIALNNEEIKNDLQRTKKTKPFISKYNWKWINYPSRKDDSKTFEENNPTFALNV